MKERRQKGQKREDRITKETRQNKALQKRENRMTKERRWKAL